MPCTASNWSIASIQSREGASTTHRSRRPESIVGTDDGLRSARALDGDEFLAAAAATEAGIGGNSPGNLVAIHLAKRTGLGKCTRLAVRGRNRHAAAGTAGQASIDAVTVGIVGDDEHA